MDLQNVTCKSTFARTISCFSVCVEWELVSLKLLFITSFLSSQWPTLVSHKILVLDHQAWYSVTSNPPSSSLFPFLIFPTFYPLATQLISPESLGNGRRSTPCAWMSIRGQRSHWDHFHPEKKGCHGCCHVACAEPSRAGHVADTGRCSKPPSPLHCAQLGKRCCDGWRWCSAPCGWCGECSNAPPRKVWRTCQ